MASGGLSVACAAALEGPPRATKQTALAAYYPIAQPALTHAHVRAMAVAARRRQRDSAHQTSTAQALAAPVALPRPSAGEAARHSAIWAGLVSSPRRLPLLWEVAAPPEAELDVPPARWTELRTLDALLYVAFIAGPSIQEQPDTQQQAHSRTRARKRALTGRLKRSGLHCAELECGAPMLAAAALALLRTVVHSFDYDWQRHAASQCKVVTPAQLAGMTILRVDEERAAVLAQAAALCASLQMPPHVRLRVCCALHARAPPPPPRSSRPPLLPRCWRRSSTRSFRASSRSRAMASRLLCGLCSSSRGCDRRHGRCATQIWVVTELVCRSLCWLSGPCARRTRSGASQRCARSALCAYLLVTPRFWTLSSRPRSRVRCTCGREALRASKGAQVLRVRGLTK